jgi:hypothetical protein
MRVSEAFLLVVAHVGAGCSRLDGHHAHAATVPATSCLILKCGCVVRGGRGPRYSVASAEENVVT